jgi:cystathionine beta-synthase
MGGSGGLAVAAALKLADRVATESVIAVIIPDSGRNYLTKYYSETWLARWGFDEPGPGLAGARAYAGVPVDSTLADARSAALGATVLPVHVRRGGTTVVAAEIVGSIDLDATRSVPSHALVREHLGAVPTLAGVGEPAAVVRERAENQGSPLVVVVDRGVAVSTTTVSELDGLYV